MRNKVAQIAVVALLATGCAPPELMQSASADAGSQDVGTQDLGTQETGVTDQVAFSQVADVVRGSCSANPSCHGGSGFTNFSVEGNATATDEQVRAALEDVVTLGEVPMVTPSEPDSSALYLRLVETGTRQMPPPGQPTLDEAQIETVRLWIEQGANYE